MSRYLVSVFVALLPFAALADDCRNVLRVHGMLSRTQFQCGFEKYGNSMFAQARNCASQISDQERMKITLSGMMQFDELELRLGHNAACEKLLHDYPMVLEK